MSRQRVVIVTFHTAQILDVTGPLEVFSSATRFVPSAQYRTELVSVAGGPVLSTSGLEFTTTRLADVMGPVDTLMVAGGRDMDEARADQELLHHLQRLAADARRVTSVCSGALSWQRPACSTAAEQRPTGQSATCSRTTTPPSRLTVTPSTSATETPGHPPA
jgi:transcriptional regulator GlxA family with amidase domain